MRYNLQPVLSENMGVQGWEDTAGEQGGAGHILGMCARRGSCALHGATNREG